MRLYYFDRSPYCIAILRALQAGGVEPEIVETASTDRAKVIQATGGAYYLIPVIDDDGRVIYESGAHSQDVAHFVDQRYLNGRLFPQPLEGLQSMLLRHLEQNVESVTFKVCDVLYLPTVADVVERTMIVRHKERKFGTGCVEQWRANFQQLVCEANGLLLDFEQILSAGEHAFLLAAHPTYTDFLLHGILGNYTYHGLLPFPSELPRLCEWNNAIKTYRYPSHNT